MNMEDLDNYMKELSERIKALAMKDLQVDKEIAQEFITEIDIFLNQRYGEVIQANHHECRRYATELLGQLFSEFEEQIKPKDLSAVSSGQPCSFDLSQFDMMIKDLSHIYD